MVAVIGVASEDTTVYCFFFLSLSFTSCFLTGIVDRFGKMVQINVRVIWPCSIVDHVESIVRHGEELRRRG